MDLDKRFDEAIKKAKFNTLEMSGFVHRPGLALKAGMAIGYRMGCKDMGEQIDGICEAAKEAKE